MQFTHLRAHTEYSVVDGTLRIDDWVAAAAADGQGALALTDLSNMFGAIRFYKEARSQGVKPLIGCDVWVSPALKTGDAPSHRLLLLAMNMQGYLNLCELLTRASLTNQRKGRAELELAWLEDGVGNGLNAGLIALSGAQYGEVGAALLGGDAARAESVARSLAHLFNERYYIELQRYGVSSDAPYIAQATALAARLQLPVVATHPTQFLQPDDFEPHEARVCIAEGEILANPRRVKRFTTEQYFKSQAQMAQLFADIPSALENTLEIAKRCNVSLVLGVARLPVFPTPNGMSPEDYLRFTSVEGLNTRLGELYPDPAKRESVRARYDERLEFEIATILRMGYPGYFLIVADFINWAKNNGCPVGPGRGSGAGSLVAYSLRITDLDPLAYNLLFERFLNPDRVSMPDFDIDFCQENRDRVIQYVRRKYGEQCVSQISTFGTMAARAAIRDVGRVLDAGYNFCDGIAKLIPNKPGQVYSLKLPPEMRDPPSKQGKDDKTNYAMTLEPQLAKRYRDEEEVRQLMTMAARLEGVTRNVGMHAGGVLIAPGKLTDFTPLYVQPGESSPFSQYDKDDVEAAGLVKFDFLGLATLTVLELCAKFIRRRYPEKANFRLEDIALDDARVYREVFCNAKTVAVFQFESRGMQGMLRDAKPDKFEDIIALVALYRPGPMDLIPSFCARKHGREEVVYADPRVEAVLRETYGIMVYQEQVMQMAQIIGGYSLGAADLLRRAMGKKKADEMAAQRVSFATGAAEKGLNELKANEIFDNMEKFAGYGFNKSHAAAYALLAVQTAWLKVYFPSEFMAANMSVSLGDSDKLKDFCEDALEMGLKFEAPDVNAGGYLFEPVARGSIRYGLGAIKGTGEGAIEAIVAERRNAPFSSLFDFAKRVDAKHVNKRVLEALVKSGAFDALHPSRAQAFSSIERAMSYAQAAVASRGQGGLFDLGDESGVSDEPELLNAQPWNLRQQLSLEKAALGFYFSGHLFDEHVSEMQRMTGRRVASLAESKEPQVVAAIITGVRFTKGQRGAMAIFTLDDRAGQIEAVAYSEVLDAKRDLLKDDELVVVRGKVSFDRFSQGLRMNVEEVWTLAQARSRFGRAITIALNGTTDVTCLHDALKRYAGEDGLPLLIDIERGGAKWRVELGDAARIEPTLEAVEALRKLSLNGAVELMFN